MSNLRALVAVSLLMFVVSSSAEEQKRPKGPPEGNHAAKFAEHKQKELARIAKHLDAIKTLQSCVQEATEHTAMKTCHETAKAAMKHEHEQHEH